jgi:hypothetical protein
MNISFDKFIASGDIINCGKFIEKWINVRQHVFEKFKNSITHFNDT